MRFLDWSDLEDFVLICTLTGPYCDHYVSGQQTITLFLTLRSHVSNLINKW